MSAPERARLDQVLVERGLAPSRHRAKALVLAGRVRVEGKRVDKPGTRIDPDAAVEVEEGRQWVGRGALKLLGALEDLEVDPSGRVALDVGASTGGFTQVLLERGASRVVAIDVGKGQLDWGLRNDSRVLVLEGRNARHLDLADLPEDLPSRPDLAVVDVSFISLRKVLPAVLGCLAETAEIVALVKPQFEAGRERVGKGGIVREAAVHREVLDLLLEWAMDLDADEGGPLAVLGLCASPIEGAAGNREFFLHLGRGRGGLEREAAGNLARRIVGKEPSRE